MTKLPNVKRALNLFTQQSSQPKCWWKLAFVLADHQSEFPLYISYYDITIQWVGWEPMGAACFYCSPMRAWLISNVIVWIKRCLILTKRQTTDVCYNGGVQRHATDRGWEHLGTYFFYSTHLATFRHLLDNHNILTQLTPWANFDRVS